MSKPVIEVEDLSKAYRIGEQEESSGTLAGAAASLARYPFRNFNRLRNLSNIREGDQADDILWALKGVSFEVKEGEVVGIIGRNGAGKSTLLKILSRITEPTGGRAVIRGRVSSLLEVGTGFHPELTGRDNIYMNGTILGMSKREIDRKFDEIVDFSGVERFLDTPVKRYSSGMSVRLAFAVAAHLEPEILIIDEVLAVGDAEFQRKCLGKMQDAAAGGRTVLFVSHNMAAVESLCTGAVIMSEGTSMPKTNCTDAIRYYLRAGLQSTTSHYVSSESDPHEETAYFSDARLLSPEGKVSSEFYMGDDITIEATIRSKKDIDGLLIAFGLVNGRGQAVARSNSLTMEGKQFSVAADDKITVQCRLNAPNLMPGDYFINLGLQCPQSKEMLERLEGVLCAEVMERDVYGTGRIPPHGATVYLDGSWATL